jgi:CRISPR system Cascade subunit CasE
MPYLSRIWLNPLRTQTQRFLRNPQAVHAAVLGGLSQQPVTQRVLWRWEPDSPHRASLLVLTQTRPSWEHLIEQAGWPGADEQQALVRPYEPLLDQVTRGREFAFRLKVNPVSATRNPQAPSARQAAHLTAQARPRGVRVAHRTVEHQLDWLIKHVPQWGFSLATGAHDLPAVKIIARDRISFSKRLADGSRGNRVTLQTATFEGIAQITDPDLTRHTLLAGVGAGKAYGLGMITFAPPQQGIALCGGAVESVKVVPAHGVFRHRPGNRSGSDGRPRPRGVFPGRGPAPS